MKKLVFIDNDREEKSKEDIRHVKHALEYRAKVPESILESIITVSDFRNLTRDEQWELLFDKNNVIITWSMFTFTHYNSLGQLQVFIKGAGRYKITGITYIDTAHMLLKALNTIARDIKEDAHFFFRGIQNNNIICFDIDERKFKRCLVDFEFDDYDCIKAVDIDILQLLE